MPVFKIPVTREVRYIEWADAVIEAETLEEAESIVQDMFDDGEIVNHCEFMGDPENAYAEYWISEDEE